MDHESLQGYAVKRIPFAHPSNLIGILAILRQQAAFNAIVTSCVRTTGVQGKFRNYSEKRMYIMNDVLCTYLKLYYF